MTIAKVLGGIYLRKYYLLILLFKMVMTLWCRFQIIRVLILYALDAISRDTWLLNMKFPFKKTRKFKKREISWIWWRIILILKILLAYLMNICPNFNWKRQRLYLIPKSMCQASKICKWNLLGGMNSRFNIQTLMSSQSWGSSLPQNILLEIH